MAGLFGKNSSLAAKHNDAAIALWTQGYEEDAALLIPRYNSVQFDGQTIQHNALLAQFICRHPDYFVITHHNNCGIGSYGFLARH